MPAAHMTMTSNPQIVDALQQLGVTQTDELIPLLQSTDENTATRACWALGLTRQKRYATALLKVLRAEHQALWQGAANGLSLLDNKRVIQPLIQIMLDTSRLTAQREAAAYALAFSWDGLGDPRYAPHSSQAFTTVLGNGHEPACLRGQVAEGLAYLYGPCVGVRDRRRRAYRHAGQLLTAALKDPAPEVRFWSAFALGSMGYRPALPALRHLAGNDQGRFGRWWSVGEEASDAVDRMEGCLPPERTLHSKSR
jgi:HEAT repeat protein